MKCRLAKQMRRVLIAVFGAVAGLILISVPAQAQVLPIILPGDIVIGVGNGAYNVFDDDGHFIGTFNNHLGPAPDGLNDTTGCTFNSLGTNLVATNFQWDELTMFALPTPLLKSHVIVGPPMPLGGDAESVVYDKLAHLYVGSPDAWTLYKYDNIFGTLDKAWKPAIDPDGRGVDWIDLASDQCTLFYTGEGSKIKRFNVCTGKQMPDFVSGLDPNTTGAFGVLILPDKSVLLADLTDIKHYNKLGQLIGTYNAPGEVGTFDGWFALALSADAKSFWAGSQQTGNFTQFNVATGAILAGPIPSGAFREGSTTTMALGGICIDGGYHAAIGLIGGTL
jgi:hypothetical protein